MHVTYLICRNFINYFLSYICVYFLLRKAGLFPYIKKYFPTLSPEKELVLDIYRSNFDDNFIFHSMQAKVFKLLTSGQNVVLSAPTSMGKSAIVDALIAERKFSTIVIVVPTIALIDETRRRIQKKFGHERLVAGKFGHSEAWVACKRLRIIVRGPAARSTHQFALC